MPHPEMILPLLWVLLGVIALVVINMLVWRIHCRLSEEIFDGDGFETRKILPFIGWLILGAWKVFMSVLAIVGWLAAFQSMSDNKNSTLNKFLR